MNTYRVSLNVEIDVDADSRVLAEKKAYETIGNVEDESGLDFESYEITAIDEIVTNIEEICFTCNKRGVGGSNDKQCPKCREEWEREYNKRHPNQ